MQLKKNITALLIAIQFILIILLSAEVEDLTTFIISKLIMLTILIINHLIIKKYGNKKLIKGEI